MKEEDLYGELQAFVDDIFPLDEDAKDSLEQAEEDAIADGTSVERAKIEILVGWLCKPDHLGSPGTREWLAGFGLDRDLVEELIESNFDLFY